MSLMIKYRKWRKRNEWKQKQGVRGLVREMIEKVINGKWGKKEINKIDPES